jgi:hypothetical protein
VRSKRHVGSQVLFLSAALALGASVCAYAGGPGTTSAELLKLPLGTRAVGMGEAFTAMADDSSALYWNPAGMSLMKQKEATFMHSSLIEGINYEHLAFVMPGDSYALGTNFSYLGYGDIAGYDNTPNAANPSGGGSPTGNVSAYSYVLNGGISRLFAESFALGLSGGLVHENLAEDTANTFAINAGALYKLPTHFWDGRYRVGVALQNMGPGMKFVSERDPLPHKINFGAAAEGIHKLPLNLTMDVSVPNDNDAYVSLGSEYWFRDMVALRLGYAGSKDEGRGVRVGVGIKYGGLLLDYAYAGYGDFGATNRISISMRFGEQVRQLNAGERAILKEAKLSEKEGSYVPAIVAYDELLDKDPTNDHILHYMINAYDHMYKAENIDALAQSQKSIAIPSPEEAAMAELVPEAPEAPAYAQAPMPPMAPGLILPSGTPSLNPDMVGDDPLNLNKLPEASALDVGVGSRFNTLDAPQPVHIPDVHEVATELPPSAEPPTLSPNSPALTPADIYGN